jgi:hypothetical protein
MLIGRVNRMGDQEAETAIVVFITTVPITKLFAGGGGGEQWRTCATRDYEPRPVWTSLPITH